MREFEIIQQIKTGDISAFEKWIEIHSKNIERLAIQYGCPPSEAGKITEDVFRTLHNNLHTIEENERLVISLYKIAVEKINAIRIMEPPNESIFSFEEDQQLHEKIIVLEENIKAPFILSQFHGMSASEIAMIVDLGEATVERRISEAYAHLDNQLEQLEKRLKFLNKSYDRIPFLFNKEQVFQNTHIEVKEKVLDEKQPLSKRVLLTWVVGFVALIAIITVPIVTGEEFQTSSDEKYIEKLYATFKEEVEQKLAEAGLLNEVYVSGVLYEMSYGPGAEAEFERFIGELKRQVATNKKIIRKETNEQFEKIIRKLELPSEMAKHLFENPLTDNKEKSEEFINEFIDSVSQLQSYYYTILDKYDEVFEEKMINGELDIEKFLEEKDSYPEGLQMALDGMINQDFNLISIRDYAPIYPNYVPDNRMRDALHKDVGGYVTWLQSDPIHPHIGTSLSIDESVDYLLEIEPTLLKSDLQTQAYDMLFGVYNYLFNNLIMNPELGRVFHRNGKIKDEYRDNWRKLASNREDLPSVYIMRKIVEEMEASNWTDSNTYSKYEGHMLEKAFSSAKRGELYSFNIEEHQPERLIVSPKDSNYQAVVEQKYNEFSADHNMLTLENVDPLVVLGVYYMANERKDPETMWHLFNNDHIPISLDDYVKDWTKELPIPDEAELLIVDLGLPSNNVSVGYETLDAEMYFLAMFLTHPTHHDVWTLQTIPGDVFIPWL